MHFGSLLKKTRIEANLTQEEIAEQLFCSRSVVSKLESDSLSLSTTRAIGWFDKANRRDIIFAFANGINPEDIVKFAFKKDYLDKMNEISQFKSNGSFTVEDLEQFIVAKSDELRQWRKYLLDLISVR
ncbi:helix-turn-helix domain-containing protein [Robertmurraya kyonggiensis]|uniref:helix-turn-helix domain-containing protein n=1 Tax=Robertmurraya kyonggiensis TaxID=1037680 RepID=UPI00130ECA4E|nr:helix-turn-helix transcriptional regulator [Robertmurraya kyonggiensis]